MLVMILVQVLSLKQKLQYFGHFAGHEGDYLEKIPVV